MFVKVCCIADLDEARLAIAAGASAIGLVSAMPSGPGPIAEDEITRIAAGVPRPQFANCPRMFSDSSTTGLVEAMAMMTTTKRGSVKFTVSLR